jgi:hypothetical protein
MSNLFKSVRIIHSPQERRYYLETKRLWQFRWECVDVFEYTDKRSGNLYEPHALIDEAYDRAKKKAELLLAKTVVWERSNYFWY